MCAIKIRYIAITVGGRGGGVDTGDHALLRTPRQVMACWRLSMRVKLK